jgi:hypothetical protein
MDCVREKGFYAIAKLTRSLSFSRALRARSLRLHRDRTLGRSGEVGSEERAMLR